MKDRTLIDDILLDEAGVDRISEALQEWMAWTKVPRKNALRCRLVFEELLEDACLRFDRRSRASVSAGRRFGAVAVTVRFAGDAYDPTDRKETDDWTRQLLENVGMLPVWSYKRGANELTLRLPREKLRGEIFLLAAFAAAVFLWALGGVLPQELVSALDTCVFSPVSTVFMGLLGTFAGIMVFLTATAGICGVGSVAVFSKLGGYLIGRNVFKSFLGAGASAAVLLAQFGNSPECSASRGRLRCWRISS